eukprot:scaffold71110_cov61-Phaeocystis_antarctica.AAC.5
MQADSPDWEWDRTGTGLGLRLRLRRSPQCSRAHLQALAGCAISSPRSPTVYGTRVDYPLRAL